MQTYSTNQIAISGPEAICKPQTKEKFFGKRFGHLVIQEAGHRRDKNDQLLLWAHCDCGATLFVRTLPLTRGQVSCSSTCIYSKCRASLSRRLAQASTTKFEKAKKRMVGLVLGRLRVEGYSHTEKVAKRCAVYYWNCSCSCGKTTVLPTHELSPKKRQSCGCLVAEAARERHTIHGRTYSKEWNSWHGTFGRCYDSNDPNYKNYGARGIKVCDRWSGRNGFISFLEDMGFKPSLRHSLDRFPDVNGNYEKSNCRWAIPKEQCRNKRNNVVLTYQGRTACIAEWAETLKIGATTIFWRYRKGMPMDKVLSTINEANGRPLKHTIKSFK